MSVAVATKSPSRQMGDMKVKNAGAAATLSQINAQPFAEVTEQPKSHGLRFRYECEGRCAGSIPGENSTDSHRTYPSIIIHNYNGPSAVVVVSLVTKDTPPKPHPHRLVGRDCKDGVCTMKLTGTYTASFPNIGIQCVKKGASKESLQKRKELRVDPFCTGFTHMDNQGDIDMSIVRLCWQVFLPDPQGKFTRALKPVVSELIYDKKTASDLTICRLSKNSGSVKGTDEVFLLCEKVHKEDIEVIMFEDRPDGTSWSAKCEFGPADVHKQHAIVLKTPPYHDFFIEKPTEVKIQLYRPSDRTTSDPKIFIYIPDDPDPDAIEIKRKRRKMEALQSFFTDAVPNGASDMLIPATVEPSSTADVKQRIIKKVTRNKDKSPVSASKASTSAAAMLEAAGDAGQVTDVVQGEEEVSTTEGLVTSDGVAAVYADINGTSLGLPSGGIILPNGLAMALSGAGAGGEVAVQDADGNLQMLSDMQLNSLLQYNAATGTYYIQAPQFTFIDPNAVAAVAASANGATWEQQVPATDQSDVNGT